MIGGFITHIVKKLGYDLSELKIVKGSSSLDIGMCLAARMITHDWDSFGFVIKIRHLLDYPILNTLL